MNGPSVQLLSIGAVSDLTGIPSHTLRKWETRHGIAVPIRTDTGRRAYTEEHVEMLRLIKLLVDRRHALAQLAPLDLQALRELANLHETTAPASAISSLALIGPNLSRALPTHPAVLERFSGTPGGWQPEHDAQFDAIMIECDTLNDAGEALVQSLSARAEQLIVTYRFGTRQRASRLEAIGARCLQGPVTDELLTNLLTLNSTGPADPPPEPRFDREELARIAALTPGIECECPNHIARLLMDIASFERYSEECVDTDPAERALHSRLQSISAQARHLFEEALIAVSTADGLPLNMNSPSR